MQNQKFGLEREIYTWCIVADNNKISPTVQWWHLGYRLHFELTKDSPNLVLMNSLEKCDIERVLYLVASVWRAVRRWWQTGGQRSRSGLASDDPSPHTHCYHSTGSWRHPKGSLATIIHLTGKKTIFTCITPHERPPLIEDHSESEYMYFQKGAIVTDSPSPWFFIHNTNFGQGLSYLIKI